MKFARYLLSLALVIMFSAVSGGAHISSGSVVSDVRSDTQKKLTIASKKLAQCVDAKERKPCDRFAQWYNWNNWSNWNNWRNYW